MSLAKNEFQFNLNEKLYFDEGYYVEDLISISLDPNITIQPSENDVSIRGVIELHGEYNKAIEQNDEGELSLDFDGFEAKRFVEEVTSLNENLLKFSHRFPVDISVPAYRIETMNDIRVEIMSFDYELPTNNQLNITAVATIYGIKADVDLLKEKREMQEEKEEQTEENHAKEFELSSFEFEIKKREPEVESELEDEVNTELQGKDAVVNPSKEQVKKLSNTRPEPLIEVREYELDSQPTAEADLREESDAPQEALVENQENDKIPEDVSYLTDMFRGETEEKYSKMRICIVQEDDTIDTIAERFQVSTLQLIKQNELEEDFDIDEGQLLYIPKK